MQKKKKMIRNNRAQLYTVQLYTMRVATLNISLRNDVDHFQKYETTKQAIIFSVRPVHCELLHSVTLPFYRGNIAQSVSRSFPGQLPHAIQQSFAVPGSAEYLLLQFVILSLLLRQQRRRGDGVVREFHLGETSREGVQR